MAKYMIHTCNDRAWYVKEYLIPSMVDQGIEKADIIYWLDEKREGNLAQFINSMKYCQDMDVDGVWHLQDDVIISSTFKQRTEDHDYGLCAGFACSYDKDLQIANQLFEIANSKLSFDINKVNDVPVNQVPIEQIWYSFCCIRIPNILAKEFIYWWFHVAVNDGEVIRNCINYKKNDDYAFRLFVMKYHPELIAYNIYPNLVNHIDYLVGGSIINSIRGERLAVSLFWDEDELVDKLAERLKADGH